MVASLNRKYFNPYYEDAQKGPIILGDPCMFMRVAVKIMVSFLDPYYDTAPTFRVPKKGPPTFLCEPELNELIRSRGVRYLVSFG